MRLGTGMIGEVFEHLSNFFDMLVDVVFLGGSVVFLDVFLKMFLLFVVETVFVGLRIAGVGYCSELLLHVLIITFIMRFYYFIVKHKYENSTESK